MKKSLFVVALAALVVSASAVASPGPKLDKKQLDPKQCAGSQIVNVEQTVVNDADSGVAGNAWANDAYKRQIKVFQTGPNTFCAITSYNGKFLTYAGPSPQNTGTVSAGVKGEFNGGYRTTDFTGTFAPTAPTHGNLGTFDYMCDASFNCPGYVDWTTLYFGAGGASFDDAWWGWQYNAANNGSWINSSDGNSGDITG